MRRDLLDKIHALHPRLVERRRDFHRHPELAYEEVRTAGIVEEWVRGLGLEVKTGVGKTGVIAKLKGARAGKTIALRADMDALPIQDVKTCDYASTVPGKMHACGHDAHTTMLLGAATVLAEMKESLDGTVVFLFQPAEEGAGGAVPMIEGGALDGVDFVLGQHMGPTHDTGEIAVTEGPAMAAADFFSLKILGKGGHGAYPHLAVDTIPVAAQVINALQTVVSRTVDPLSSAVLTIGTVKGGYRSNVIADVVEMTGTVRTLDATLREQMPGRIEAVIKGITEAHGARYQLDYKLNYPPVVNHKGAVALLRKVGADVLGAPKVKTIPPSMGGEDFAYYLQKVPGCFYWLGCRKNEVEGGSPNIHHPAFDIDENALDVGVQMFVETTLAFLSARSS